MRMRKKKNLPQRLEQVQELLVPNPSERKGHWRTGREADARLWVELGCGKGTFARTIAARHPNDQVVGIEIVPDVLVMAAEACQREGLDNLRFILGDAQALPEQFAPGEIDKLFIHFCDPWPHWKQARKRLVARGFLDKYRPLLHKDGTLTFKTDNAPLFAFAQKELAAAGWRILTLEPNLPASEDNIETEYETRFRSKGIPIGCLEAMAADS